MIRNNNIYIMAEVECAGYDCRKTIQARLRLASALDIDSVPSQHDLLVLFPNIPWTLLGRIAAPANGPPGYYCTDCAPTEGGDDDSEP